VPQVEIPRRYRLPTRGESPIDVEGRTVRECIEAVEARYPGFLELVFDSQGHLNRFVRLFVNGDEIARDDPDAPVGDDDRIQILAAAAGG
jgi:molybdopterin converting factor small subunit